MPVITRIALPVAASLALAGCATSPLANKTADDAAIYTLQQSSLDARYNFDGTLRISDLDMPAELGSLANPDLVKDVARSFSFDMRGAVDMPASRIELVPTFRFARPNLESWVRVPMLFQLNTLTAWVDASALDLALPQLHGKLLKLTVPQDKVADIPVDAVMRDLPLIIGKAYAAVDKKAFTFQPLSDSDRQKGASYRIRLTLDPAADAQLGRIMLQEVAARVKRYSASKEVQALADKLSEEVAMAQGEMASESQTELLVDSQAKLLAMEEQRTLRASKLKGFSVTLRTQMAMRNHGQPVFTVLPTAANVLTLDELKAPSWFSGVAGKGGDAEPVEAAEPEVDAAEAAVPAQAAPVAPAAKAKAKPRKPQPNKVN
ncbi:hypothetical protein PQU95_05825 [Vogesella sp. DC21W]|uniref:Lipoprotein n=1 Tax=Vogesella aquatica TaxID=2984206 RepID=A0ABT5IX09_9NEIS|nr:hypothetical protein [Vogesella aquatica]MDC7716733.1 hypothetical protein [Vogesella aquatica]